MKPSTPSRSRPSASASQRASSSWSRLRQPQVRRRDLHQRRDALRVREREGERRRGAHRGADQHDAVEPRSSSTASRSRDQVGVLVGARIRRGVGVAVPARVVGDHAVAGALQQPRAVHDVAARRRQPVREHERRRGGAPRRPPRPPATRRPTACTRLGQPPTHRSGSTRSRASCARARSPRR